LIATLGHCIQKEMMLGFVQSKQKKVKNEHIFSSAPRNWIRSFRCIISWVSKSRMTGTEKDHFFILFYTSIYVCMMGHRHHYSKKIYFVFDTLLLYFMIYHYIYIHLESRTFGVRKVSGKGFCWSFGTWHIGHPVIAQWWDVETSRRKTMRRLDDKTTMWRRRCIPFTRTFGVWKGLVGHSVLDTLAILSSLDDETWDVSTMRRLDDKTTMRRRQYIPFTRTFGVRKGLVGHSVLDTLAILSSRHRSTMRRLDDETSQR